MPTQVKEKVSDPEAELSNAMRSFKTLAPKCSVAKRAEGEPQFAMQEKQMNILRHEMHETMLCITLASKGQHSVRDAGIKSDMLKSIVDYESLEAKLRDERWQLSELDLLNYLAKKRTMDLSKTIPKDSEAEAFFEASINRLRRMENRLDIATTRFCRVNTENKRIRDEIHRLLVERNNFNVYWNRTLGKLVKGKEYLMDICEIATAAFGARDEICRKLDTLKWMGLFQLNKDISEMQAYEGELNHLGKLEEFLRMKGSRRLCEADEIEEMKRQEEIIRCENEVAKYEALLEEIYDYAGTTKLSQVVHNFDDVEKLNFSLFVLLCELMQEIIFVTKDLKVIRQKILDACDQNEARIEKQGMKIAILIRDLDEQRYRTQDLKNQHIAAEAFLIKIYKDIDELFRIAKCDLTPLVKLLGKNVEVRKHNVRKFLTILEWEVKSLVEVAYNVVKPPAPTPKVVQPTKPPTKQPTKQPAKQVVEQPPEKVVADPRIEIIRPNKIEKLVPYLPCAYCVEDYVMNQVFETPAVPADRDYIETMFHLEDDNTPFGIYTLTIPAKRHPLSTKTD